MTNELFTYLIKCVFVFSLLYLPYKPIFAKSTFFQLNRAYLLLIVPFAFLIPTLSLPSSIQRGEFTVLLPQFETTTTAFLENSFNYLAIVFGVSLLFLLGFLKKLTSILVTIYKINRGRKVAINPFSFFGFVHVPKELNTEDAEVILAHENVHSQEWHSLDVMIYELMKVVFWFNPLVWLASKDVKNNHEFIADNIASKNNVQSYSKVLVAQLLGANCSDLANNFNYEPLIKKRIKMMKKMKQQKVKASMYALALPVICLAILTTSSVSANIETTQPIENDQTEKVYEKVEQMPEFKGGMEGLFSFIGKNLVYPKKAMDSEGTVFISFVVNKTGKVENVTVMKGVNDALDNEALRVMKTMPDWTPGKHEGKNVNVKMVLPIKYQKG